MRLFKLFYFFLLSFSVNAMDEFIIASAGQVVEPTPQIEEEAKKPELKPEDPPVVKQQKCIRRHCNGKICAEIDNDLKKTGKLKRDFFRLKENYWNWQSKKTPVNTVEQASNSVPADAKTVNIETSMNKDSGGMISPVENLSDSNISKLRIIGSSPIPVMHDEAMKALKTLIGDLDKIKFDNSMTTINGQKFSRKI